MAWVAIVIAVFLVLTILLLVHILLTCVLGSKDDAVLVEAERLGGVEHLYVSNGYTLAYRLSVPSSDGRHRCILPICIPNGLAATMVTTGAIHDALVRMGFTVLSYDRVGVGFSDVVEGDPTVSGTMQDMVEVMRAAASSPRFEEAFRDAELDEAGVQKWILLGPSMGSVVAQCFMLEYPDMVGGFLNMDGFPAPFSSKGDKFTSASTMYKVLGVFAAAGIIRPFLFLARSFFSAFATDAFSVAVISAQMNRRRFWTNTAKEFKLMIDLAVRATEGWGSLDVLQLSKEHLLTMGNIAPANNGDLDEFTMEWVEQPRSSVEIKERWESEEVEQQVRAELLEKVSASELGSILSRMPVRVMSARSYDYMGGDSFYDQDMKELAAAEHTVQALIGNSGKRYVFPALGHDKIFLNKYAVAQCILEIMQELGA